MNTSKRTKILLLIAGGLLVVGGILATAGYALGGMKPVGLTGSGPVLGTGSGELVTVDEQWTKLTSVDIDTSVFDLKLEEGDSFALKGSYNPALIEMNISESNGVLTVRGVDKRHGVIGFNFGVFDNWGHDLVLTYPKGTKFKEVIVHGDLGNLETNNLSAETLSVDLNAGNFTATKVTATTFTVDMDMGNCEINDLQVSGSAQTVLHAGNLTLRNSNVTDLTTKTDMGSMNYTGVLKGKADLSLDLGSLDLDLDLAEKDLSYSVKCDLGSITLNGRSLGSSARVSESSSVLTLAVSSNLGSVTIRTK